MIKRCAWLLALAGLTTLTSVAGATPNRDAGSKASVTLHVYFHSQDSPLQQQYERDVLIGQFEKSHPDIKVEATWMANPRNTINQQLAAGAGPDILITDGSADVANYASAGDVIPLDKWAGKNGWMKEFPSWSYPLMSYKNKLYAVPNKMDILFLFSNKTLLAKNGWKTPTSYDQLANVCKQAQAKNIVCMTLGTSDIPNANEWYLTTAVNANLGNGFKKVMSGKLPWTSPGMKDTITKLNDLYNAGAIENKQSAAIPLNQAFAQFESGKALFEVAGTWLLGPWASKPPSFKLGTSVMPAWGSAKPTLPLAIGQTMLINKHSSHPEEAAEFLAWVEKPSTLNAALKPVGVPPLASLNLPAIAKVSPLYAQAARLYVNAQKTGTSGWASWSFWPPDVRVYAMQNLNAVWLGQTSLDDYLKQLQALYKKDRANGSYGLFAS